MSESKPHGASPDPELEGEIDSALEGIDLQEIGLPPRRGASPGAGDDSGLRPGTVTGVHGDDVFVELGPRMQGVIARAEFDEPPRVGDVFEFSLHGQEDGLWVLSRREAKVLSAWRDLALGSHVKAEVKATNRGGLECQVGPLSAFLPASQAALGHVEDLSTLVGQTFVCEVTECDRERKRVVISRRRVLEEEREASRRDAVETLTPGVTVRGPVTRIEDFGAFVELAPGLEGLVHVSNLSRKRVQDPRELLSPGQVVEAMVLDVREGGKRIGLGMKQLEPDPWDDVQYRFRIDEVVQGKVTRLAPFGAFVEVAEGLEGLLHVSQMGDAQRGTPIHRLVREGEELPVRIQAIETERRRLSLSRLDVRGAVIGSEDAAEAGEVDRVLHEHSEPRGTNLGALFKRALESDQE